MAVKTQEQKTGNYLLNPDLVKIVEVFRSTIINQLSHMAPVNLVRKEAVIHLCYLSQVGNGGK